MENLKKFIEQNQEKIIQVHWNETINEYVKNIELSKIVLDNLSKEEFFSQSANFFKTINKSIDNYVENVKNPIYQIAIVGAIKAGKSTLINALIGHELASVNVTPETATLTKFRHTEKNLLKIKFYTPNEWNEIWNDAINKKAEIFIEEYRNLNSDTVKDELLGKEEKLIEFDSIDDMKEEISKWTSSKRKEHYFVKEIEIGVKDLKLPSQISLVDTPGLNDIIDYRSKITRDYIDSANSVIICVNAKTLRNEELVTISRVFQKARYKKDKIYVLGTQIDTMNSQEDWKKQRADWVRVLERKEYFESHNKAEFNLKGISSYFYLKALEMNKDNVEDMIFNLLIPKNLITRAEGIQLSIQKEYTDEIIEELREKIIEYTNMKEIIRLIQNKLLKNFNNSLVEDFTEKYKILKSEMKQFIDEYKTILIEKTEDLEKTEDELNEKIELERKKIKEIENINNNLERKIKETTDNFNMDFSKLAKNFKDLEEGIKKIKID